MQEPGAVIAVKTGATVATAAAIAFGLNGWAVAAALAGAAASVHFEKEAEPSTLLRLLLGITAMGFLAAMLASALPKIPGFAWTGDISVAVRAGILGVFVNQLYPVLQYVIGRLRSVADRMKG